MEKRNSSSNGFFGSLGSFLRRCIFRILSIGPIPNHIAFIMDGNRRYAKKQNMEEGAGHRAGYLALLSVLKYCYELRVKYVTIYAFSIENFKRRPDEVQDLMNLMLEKIEGFLKEESIINEYGIRVYFIGNLKLLNDPVRLAAEKVMKATAKNSNCVLLICVAYTSCDEIVHAVQESCTDRWKEIKLLNAHATFNVGIEETDSKNIITRDVHEANKSLVTKVSTACKGHSQEVEGTEKNGMVKHVEQGSCADKKDEAYALKANRTGSGMITDEEIENMQGKRSIVKLVDIEKHMYMAVAPDPDILIRSSGETRLSNFLLWQSSNSPLYSPNALWPEIGLWHLVWAVLNFQRNHSYLEKKKKQF